ncbi:hypothetical protein CRE_21504 [Caenorhabditis remanei]|uniref:Uncharacterized protein n=1 Tax=Caenorhabditis remanei TaxID=31234 RepID=E3N8X5_CAERE|nr:hypothetical protein CRE_21504 [Caenorhabditis remanei]
MEIDSAGDDTDPVETIRVLREQLELLEKEHNRKMIAKMNDFQRNVHLIHGKLDKAEKKVEVIKRKKRYNRIEIQAEIDKNERLKRENEVLAKDEETLVEQNERTERSRHFLMQQEVALENQIVAMKREMEELSAENEKKSSEILNQKDEIIALKRQPREIKLINYDNKVDYLGLESKLFYKDVVNKLERDGIASLKLSPQEGFQAYHSANFTRQSYKTIKKILKDHQLPDPFPPIKGIISLERKVASDDVFTVYQSKGVKDEGKIVTVAHLNDVAKTVSERIEQLIDTEKLTLDFDKGIWLTNLGDKGGQEVKLCLSIGNVDLPNSCHNLIPLGVFDDEESSEALLKHIPTVIDQLNNLKELKITVNNTELLIPVDMFLGDDMKFQYDMLGHQGASATNPCMFCLKRGRIKIRDYKRGERTVRRTEKSYSDASAKGSAKTTVESVKSQSSFVFTGISLDHVTIPSLHTIMGVAQGFGFDNLLLWTTTMDCEDKALKITKADIKQSRVRKSNLINLQKTVQMLDVELSSMLTVAVVLQHFQDSTLDGTDETERAACPAEKCLYRDRSIGKAPLFDARLVKCETCEETSVVRLCVPRKLHPEEMEDMENAIDTMWLCLQEFAADDNVTPELYALLEHVMEFVETHHTWAKTSEHPIEAFHAAYNTSKLRYRTTRNDLLRAKECFKRCLINNRVFDLS